MSGDEADVDGDIRDRMGEPHALDFEPKNLGESSRSEQKSKKKYKRKYHRRHRNKDQEEEKSEKLEKSEKPENSTTIQTVNQPEQQDSHPRVGFVDEVIAQDEAARTKRTFGLASRTGRPVFRPALPKVLSNTVFSATPLPNPQAPVVGPPRGLQPGLRRTNSLPDRLNKSVSIPSVTAGQPLHPYVQQRLPPGEGADADEDEAQEYEMSRTAAVVMLLISTGLVALCAEFLVDAIPAMTKDNPVISQAFIGLIILPIVGNAAEHVTAVTVATKNKMDLAIGVAVGSSIQIGKFPQMRCTDLSLLT